TTLFRSSLLGSPLAECQETTEAPVSCAVARICEQARRILEIEPCADDEFDPADFLGGKMGAHHASKRVAIGDGDGLELMCLCRRHQLLCMGAATQEGEIGSDIELGVARHGGSCRLDISFVMPAKAGSQ